jgi:hypothetical protein
MAEPLPACSGFAMGFAIGCGVRVVRGVAQGVAAEFIPTTPSWSVQFDLPALERWISVCAPAVFADVHGGAFLRMARVGWVAVGVQEEIVRPDRQRSLQQTRFSVRDRQPVDALKER